MNRLIIVLMLATAIVSCDSEKDVATDPNHGFEVAAGDSLFIVGDPGFRVGFTLPKDLMAANEADVAFNSNTGQLEIKLGAKFQLDIAQENVSIQDLKDELADDQFFSFKFFDETEKSMMYQPVLPDGQAFYYHYVEQLSFDSVEYVVRTSPSGEFALENIKNMKRTIQSLKPV